MNNSKEVYEALAQVGYKLALKDGNPLSGTKPILINEDGDVLTLGTLTPQVSGTSKYHKLSVTENGKNKTLPMHKVVMETFVGTPANWIESNGSNGLLPGITKKDWAATPEKVKDSVKSMLGANGVQIDHRIPISKDASANAYKLSNLQYMFSSDNNKKGGK